MNSRTYILSMSVLMSIALNAFALSSMKEDRNHIRKWNTFADAIYQLHQHHIKKIDIRTEVERGGYPGLREFFEETRYYNRQTGKLVSRIQRETENRNNIHLIEVFVYDEKNRLMLDYLAAYLPKFRNAPIQTLISLHRYNDMLHAFRQFDASGALINEQCEGKLFDEEVFITLDEDEIINRHAILTSDTENNQYHSCFEFIPKQAGRFIHPANLIKTIATNDDNSTTTVMQSLTNKIESAAGSDEQRSLLYLERADLHFTMQAFKQAVNDYNKALALNKNLDKAYFGRGMALGRQGLVQQGIDSLTEYIKRHPYDSHAYTKRGVRYIWLGKLVAAKKDLNEAVLLDVTNAEAHDDLGVVYASENNFDKAIYHFKQSIYYDKSYQKAYHNLAMAYVVTENFTKALVQVDKGLLLENDNRNSLLLKSTILEKLGRHEQANTIKEHAEFLPEGNWSERFSM